MQITSKIDSGKIAHQIRPEFESQDKIIKKTVIDLCQLLTKKKIIKFYDIRSKYKTKIYKRSDFNKNSLRKALNNIKENLIPKYILKYKKTMEKKYPIISQL